MKGKKIYRNYWLEIVNIMPSKAPFCIPKHGSKCVRCNRFYFIFSNFTDYRLQILLSRIKTYPETKVGFLKLCFEMKANESQSKGKDLRVWGFLSLHVCVPQTATCPLSWWSNSLSLWWRPETLTSGDQESVTAVTTSLSVRAPQHWTTQYKNANNNTNDNNLTTHCK